MVIRHRPWQEAWLDAAYGPDGFWRGARPSEHFRTASSTSPHLLADLLGRLLDDHPAVRRVIELGAADGQLLAALGARRPHLDLVGVDLRDRPAQCPDAVSWCQDLWDVLTSTWRTGAATQLLEGLVAPALVVCAEWLDDLPCPVAVRRDNFLHLVEVDGAGVERAGDHPAPEEAAWATRWSPWARRFEIGLPRDRAWAWVCEGLRPYGGLALLIDYGHVAARRPAGGSLTAFRFGRQVTPRPTPDVNLTAAVAIDSLAAAGQQVGARTLLQTQQHQILPRAGTGDHPADPLAALVDRSHRAAFASRSVWGDQWWLLQQVPADPGLGGFGRSSPRGGRPS